MRRGLAKDRFDYRAWLDRLEKVVHARAITWAQLSEATGVSTTTLSRMRNDGRQPDASSLAVLSAWARINPAKFVKEENHER